VGAKKRAKDHLTHAGGGKNRATWDKGKCSKLSTKEKGASLIRESRRCELVQERGLGKKQRRTKDKAAKKILHKGRRPQ